LKIAAGDDHARRPSAAPISIATPAKTAPFSPTDNPVVVLPTGIDTGLPVGLQWIGKHRQDERLQACCAQVEQALGGYVPPPSSE
jgi:amidase